MSHFPPSPFLPQVLANDVVEFMPYVFQIFSQLLELRPAGEFSDVSCLRLSAFAVCVSSPPSFVELILHFSSSESSDFLLDTCLEWFVCV